jgi:hypothetical protein
MTEYSRMAAASRLSRSFLFSAAMISSASSASLQAGLRDHGPGYGAGRRGGAPLPERLAGRPQPGARPRAAAIWLTL